MERAYSVGIAFARLWWYRWKIAFKISFVSFWLSPEKKWRNGHKFKLFFFYFGKIVIQNHKLTYNVNGDRPAYDIITIRDVHCSDVGSISMRVQILCSINFTAWKKKSKLGGIMLAYLDRAIWSGPSLSANRMIGYQ